MLKIKFVHMPFAIMNSPSLALTQLKTLAENQYGDQVATELHYLNLEFARYMGTALYQYVALAVEGLVSGIGEWFFRQSAFPDLPDNTQEYFDRYYPVPNQSTQVLKYALLKKRKTVDAFLDELIDRYELDQADVVAFTSRLSQNMAVFAISRKLKQRNPNLITIMGGPNCDSPMGQEIARSIPQMDFVVSGPGLKAFSDFIGCTLKGDIAGRQRINGVFCKANLDRVVQAPLNEPIPEDALRPFGDLMDINTPLEPRFEPFLQTFGQYFPNKEINPVLTFETSRGCWWGGKTQCTVCGLPDARVHYNVKCPENALEQFKKLFEYPKPLYLTCVDNTMPKTMVREVFSQMEAPEDVVIYYSAKPSFSESDIQILAKAGVRVIQVEIEALDSGILKMMNTGSSLFQNLICLKSSLMYGVYPVWNFLVGIPGEDEAMYRGYVETIPYLMHLPPPTGVQTVMFERHSHYFRNAEKYDLDLRPDDMYKLVYPFDDATLRNLACRFTNHNIGAPYLKAMTKWINKVREQCDPWAARWEDPQTAPKLHLQQSDTGLSIYDSRMGEAVEHTIDAIDWEVLQFFNKPARRSDLEEQMPDAADRLERLHSLHLLLEEKGRYINLVLPFEPPQISQITRDYLTSFFNFFSATSAIRRL